MPSTFHTVGRHESRWAGVAGRAAGLSTYAGWINGPVNVQGGLDWPGDRVGAGVFGPGKFDSQFIVPPPTCFLPSLSNFRYSLFRSPATG